MSWGPRFQADGLPYQVPLAQPAFVRIGRGLCSFPWTFDGLIHRQNRSNSIRSKHTRNLLDTVRFAGEDILVPTGLPGTYGEGRRWSEGMPEPSVSDPGRTSRIESCSPFDRRATERLESLKIRDSYSSWLSSVTWSTFGTFTFGRPRTVRRSGELFERWSASSLSDADLVVYGAEPHQSGAGHLHALIAWHPWLNPGASSIAASRAWRRDYGRVVMAPYDRRRGATWYLTKYVLKDSLNQGTWGVIGGEHVRQGEDLADGGSAGETDPPQGQAGSGGGVSTVGVRQSGDWPLQHAAPEDDDGPPWRTQKEVDEEVDRQEFLEEVLREFEETRRGREVRVERSSHG